MASGGEETTQALKRYRSASMEELGEKKESENELTEVTAMNIPEELWAYIMTFVEDTDLRTLCRVNHLLRRQASDKILWRRYIVLRNRHRVSSRLFVYPQRPTRKDLVEWNILRTMPFRQDDVGYINNPIRVAHWTAREVLRKCILFTTLRRGLEERPSVQSLESMKVLRTDPYTALILCPSIKPKVRFFEDLCVNGAAVVAEEA
ncbi:uncharacterized protein SPPG_03483 [Spizellomyces punctatus DAOM BR117]|uniref:F-box domain-containing protein n=1 Tax=Spizellomyces punctatus (strain DAOM BR117) TaxID=645134 RepID=A0A0L0HKW5_SPIPD|nr:uncharacterized protein SPPG_03483 [Spizellomyces punctatus DAOM BR117]KND01688.1 hypothetical protein SPPG_03483 [Spizellomyces punctatus DAOM BR117]|eukprot:XP_016609727.1 hypothetical protein SPPG_03483 [Spizellomyces punctatus DAOM BR117]